MYSLKIKSNYLKTRYWEKINLRIPTFKEYHRKNNNPAIESFSYPGCWLPLEWWESGNRYYKITTSYSKETRCYTGDLLHSFSDLPAVEYANGTKEWYHLGTLHRYQSPAIIYSNGDKEWWWVGQKHRFGGPAMIYGNKQYWFIEGEFIKCIV
ncbi:MAG: hypothetical protein EKK64_03060 [Neisseriaceae bacterium]|nr:MAG: hypothetical protein EKK64_03060 [Neisseriaceae bacterium]